MGGRSMKNTVRLLAAMLAAGAIAAAGTGISSAAADTVKSPSTGETQQQETKDLGLCSFSFAKTKFTYSGKAIKPEDQLLAFDGSEPLVKGVDFTVSYSDNKETGRATATFKGIGKYTGTTEASFFIVPATQEITALTTGKGIRVEWREDKHALAYQVLYSQDSSFKTYHSTTVKGKTYVNLTNVPKPGEKWYIKVRGFVTFDGQLSSSRYGNYSGVRSITCKYDIGKVTIPYISYTYSGKAITPPVTVRDIKGSKLSANSYTASYSYNVKVGIAKITVKGKGSYSGTYVKEFYVKPAKNKITSITSKNGAFKISWEKGTAGTVGYQVLYSTTSDFSSNVHSYTSTALDDLSENFSKVPRAGETWYVKVRSFFTRDGNKNSTRYGNYSAVKKIRTIERTAKTTAYAQLYGQAGYSPKSIGSVYSGTSVNIISQNGRWYYIEVGGKEGWIYNKALGVSANTAGGITEGNVAVYCDDLLFGIGTSAKAIQNYVHSRVYYAHMGVPTASRDGLAAYALAYRRGACYYYSATCDLLLERAGYVHRIVKGHSTTGEHHWNLYLTDNGWRYLDSCPFIDYGTGFYDFTGDQVRNIRSFTWDRAAYEKL